MFLSYKVQLIERKHTFRCASC